MKKNTFCINKVLLYVFLLVLSASLFFYVVVKVNNNSISKNSQAAPIKSNNDQYGCFAYISESSCLKGLTSNNDACEKKHPGFYCISNFDGNSKRYCCPKVGTVRSRTFKITNNTNSFNSAIKVFGGTGLSINKKGLLNFSNGDNWTYDLSVNGYMSFDNLNALLVDMCPNGCSNFPHTIDECLDITTKVEYFYNKDGSELYRDITMKESCELFVVSAEDQIPKKFQSILGPTRK